MILATLCICLFSVYHGKNLRLLYQWSVVFLTHHLLKELPDGDDDFLEEVIDEEEHLVATDTARIQACAKQEHDAAIYCLKVYQQGRQLLESGGELEQPAVILSLDSDGTSEDSSSGSRSSLEERGQPGKRRVAFQNVTIRYFVRVAAQPELAGFHSTTQPIKAAVRLTSIPLYNSLRYRALKEKQQTAPSIRAKRLRSTVARDEYWSVVVVSETTVTVDEFERSKRRSYHYSSLRSVSHTVSKIKNSTQVQHQEQTYKTRTKRMKKKNSGTIQIMSSCGARPFILEGELTSASTTSNRQRD